ncbi:hydroxyethylthiazole kinase [Elusimicrobium posterum]|uniref:hydroxyethylthiazole kinase n=1 Tax=Elusimicrobium posterum TaxID=3116653 RepID=UPI003C792E10
MTEITNLLAQVRAKKPLVHHITNYVTVNDCANITLAIGASPIMADDKDEVKEIVSISSALVLNIGTLNERTIKSTMLAGEEANKKNVPVIFDPVGAGASRLRNETAAELIKKVRFAVVRGNMSEIRFLAGLSSGAKGVDVSEADKKEGLEGGIATAKELALKLNTVVAITGATDIISDGKKTYLVKNGFPEMESVSGTGCMCNSLVASFCGATGDFLRSAAAGIAAMCVAGEKAFSYTKEKGFGSFRVALIDEISKLSPETLSQAARIDEA